MALIISFESYSFCLKKNDCTLNEKLFQKDNYKIVGSKIETMFFIQRMKEESIVATYNSNFSQIKTKFTRLKKPKILLYFHLRHSICN